jgi:ribosomal-protein-alanine N-acetyltransferase
MIAAMILETPRLRLRPLAAVDAEPCLALWTNPDVMRYVSPVPVTRAQAEAVFAHYRPQVEKTGYGHWAIEVKGGDAFAGIILLEKVKFTAAFTPAIEVGWLLAPDQWGNGYATEGAKAALDYAFTHLNLSEVVALTAAGNLASQRVMERLGMTHDPLDDFDHPHAVGTALRRCVLFRIRQSSAG